MSLSAWMTTSNGGDFATIQSHSVNTTIADYRKWETSICTSSPYIYIEPFSFTYDYDGVSYGNAAYCGFPRSNSVLRIFTCVLSILVLGSLYFDTPFSSIGRTCQMILACLYFSSFVLDADAVATGTSLCESQFTNTFLNVDIQKLGLTLTCNMADYAGLAVINLILAILLLLLEAAWSHCTDLYSGIPGSAQI